MIPGEFAVADTGVADNKLQAWSLTLPIVNVGVTVTPFLLDDGTLLPVGGRIYVDKTVQPIYADRTPDNLIYRVN